MTVYRKKGFWATAAALCVVLLAAFLFEKNDYATQLSIAAGYQAKILCSAVFVSKRNPKTVLREDIAIHPLMHFIGSRIDRNKKDIVSSTLGLFKARAVYLDKLGAVLLSGVPEETVRSWPVRIPDPWPEDPASFAWPTGDLANPEELPAGVERPRIEEALERVFAEPEPAQPLRTRAVVVLYQGKIVAERYAPGYSRDMPLIGWSMSKTVTVALAGLRVGEGKLSLKDPVSLPEWKRPGDRRGAITLEELLWMSGGLEFDEEYETKPVSDVNRMLFTMPDMAAYAAGLPLVAEPGSAVHYSSGTTNIISRLIRQSFASQEDYFAFPRRSLFNKIGMRSALIEPDASGTFSSASYVYASARDWARFGLLLLNGGVWEGRRVLPEGWVEFMTTPSPASGRGDYGAQTWLNRGPAGRPDERPYPTLPPDMFKLHGYQDQITVVIPSRQLVLVRLGMTTKGDFPLEVFIADILKAIPNSPPG
ncbi:MAG: beta-lactamase family protein [Candidatus Aminicenantes bacterium]|nr:beta-lactamase family protein [Candidatus Aminicenantes bacterium]